MYVLCLQVYYPYCLLGKTSYFILDENLDATKNYFYKMQGDNHLN